MKFISLVDVIALFLLVHFAQGQNYDIVNVAPTSLMNCFECNVWKAGYGQLCDNPRIRSGCYACMKVETIIFMGYYKNTPRYSTVISRACANSKSVPFYSECQYFTMGDGHSRRCYCNTPLCNMSHRTTLPTLSLLSASCFVVMLLQKLFLNWRTVYFAITFV